LRFALSALSSNFHIGSLGDVGDKLVRKDDGLHRDAGLQRDVFEPNLVESI